MTTSSSPDPTLECHNLTQSFGSQRVLRGLTMTLRPGRVYALLGRNGAGKSTTFKIILGLDSPDGGEVRCGGRVMATHDHFNRDMLSHIGASVDGPALYPHLSALEHLKIHAMLLGIGVDAAPPMLDIVGLNDAGRKPVKKFSTGMKARLALAIAMLNDPDILMLDEPQNGLDPQGIVELRTLIRNLAAKGRTILVSSHQLGEVAHLADDIGVLNEGHLVYEGSLQDFASPGNLERTYLAATAVPSQPSGQHTASSKD